MTKQNSFVKNLKNISKSINNLLERNLNKLKFDNLRTLASNNKIILTFVALFVLFVSYLLIPTLYKESDTTRVLKSELLSKFNLDFTFTQNFNYNLFPRPHFVSKNLIIIENQKKISHINKIKIFISLENLFSSKKININKVILENANFDLNHKNYSFFIKLLNNDYLDTNLKIINSNIFFRNLEKEVLFINKIKNLNYYYNHNELENVLYSENEIFNLPYSIEVINRINEKKLYTKLNLSLAKVQIENVHKYDDDIKSGSSIILFNKIKSLVNYKTNSNFFEFELFNRLDKKQFLYSGKLNFKPFYSNFKGTTDEINLSYLFGRNAFLAELLKTEIFNNKNLDLKININAKKIKNNQDFTNLFINSKIEEGLIDIDETEIEWKNNLIKLTDTLIYVKDGKLFLDGKLKVNIKNVKNIYQFLLTPKNFRKKINIVDLNISYSFYENAITINGIMIDGKYNQKVNDKLNNVFLQNNDLQNKIFLKNIMNDLLEAYAG